MNKRTAILEDVEEALFVDGFDDAIVGFCVNSGRVIYSVNGCVETLLTQYADEEQMSREDALEWVWYNVIGSYVGDKTPIFMQDVESLVSE